MVARVARLKISDRRILLEIKNEEEVSRNGIIS